jgi:hypothetical protein
MAQMISWIATIATIVAASMTAANLGSRVTGYGFLVFAIGAVCWIAVGFLTHQPALLWTNVVLTFLDMFGIWRWLRRQAEVEEGASAASAASENSSGETLFPVSLLTHAVVKSRDGEIGHCVDAMAGCESGRLSYVVISEGGIAGVGEKLRRLPWCRAQVDGGIVLAKVSAAQFEELLELPRDQWPAR